MVIGRLLALCKRDEQPEDNRGKVCLANGKKYVIQHTQTLRVRDVCIEIAKILNIAPVALDFFTLMTTACEHCLRPSQQTKQQCTRENDHYLSPKRLLHADECSSKVFFFRLAFKAIPGPDIKMVDKGAFKYFVMQCRWDYLNGRISGLTKKDHLTLLILECIIRGDEHNITGREVLDNPKKYGVHHMFADDEFSVREIRSHLKKQITQFRLCQENVDKARNSFLCVLEGVPDFGITKIVVNKSYFNNVTSDVYQVEWEILISAGGLKKRRTYKDEGDFNTKERGQPSSSKDEIISDYKDIEYLEIKEAESAVFIHISRLQGFLEVISIGKSMSIKKENLITLIEGFYRLLANRYKALTKYAPGLELPMPTNQRQELEIHAPIERKKAEALLKAVACADGDSSGVHMIRRSRHNFDSYNLSFICRNEFKHYEIEMSPDGQYGIVNGPRFDSLVELLEFYKGDQPSFPTPLRKYCPIPREGLCAMFDEQIVVEAPCPPSTSRPINPDYEFEQIGNMQLQKLQHNFTCGNFGERFIKGRWLKTDSSGQEVFCRRLVPSRSPNFKDKVIRSANKMAGLVHRNLVQFLGVCFYNDQNTYLTFEWIPDGTLDDYLIKEADITVEAIIMFAAQISEACMFLHQNNYVHGWLAAHNVLVASRELVKVSDVSVPCLREEHLLQPCDEVNRSAWKARECFSGRSYSKESDVWAFGVVLWEMFMKTKPFQNMSDESIIKIFQQDRHLACPKWCPSEVGKIMRSCWMTEPSKRPSFANIVLKLRSVSSNLTPQEKQRRIPETIDETFIIEPLMSNKPSCAVALLDEELPCMSPYESSDHGNSGETNDSCWTNDSRESFSGSSSDGLRLDLIPEKETREYSSAELRDSNEVCEMVWSPDEIEMKTHTKKYPRKMVTEVGPQEATYDQISRTDLPQEMTAEIFHNSSHQDSRDVIPIKRECELVQLLTIKGNTEGQTGESRSEEELMKENSTEENIVEDLTAEQKPTRDKLDEGNLLLDQSVPKQRALKELNPGHPMEGLTEDYPVQRQPIPGQSFDERTIQDFSNQDQSLQYQSILDQMIQNQLTQHRLIQDKSTHEEPIQGKVMPDQATKGQGSEHESIDDRGNFYEAESEPNSSNHSLYDLDHIGFLACQLEPSNATGFQWKADPSKENSESSIQDASPGVSGSSNHTDYGHDSGEGSMSLIQNLDPFASDSDARTAQMFDSLTSRKSNLKDSNRHPYGRADGKKPNLTTRGNPSGYVGSPLYAKTEGIHRTNFPDSAVKTPASSLPAKGNTTADRLGSSILSSGGLLQFSNLDPFASLDVSDICPDEMEHEDSLKSPFSKDQKPARDVRSLFDKSRNQSMNLYSKLGTASEREQRIVKGEKDEKTPLLSKSCSFEERDPFSEILTGSRDLAENSAQSIPRSDVSNSQDTPPLAENKTGKMGASNIQSPSSVAFKEVSKDTQTFTCSNRDSGHKTTTFWSASHFQQNLTGSKQSGNRNAYVSVPKAAGATCQRIITTPPERESNSQTRTSVANHNTPPTTVLPGFSERDPFSEMLQATGMDDKKGGKSDIRKHPEVHQSSRPQPAFNPPAKVRASGTRAAIPQVMTVQRATSPSASLLTKQGMASGKRTDYVTGGSHKPQGRNPPPHWQPVGGYNENSVRPSAAGYSGTAAFANYSDRDVFSDLLQNSVMDNKDGENPSHAWSSSVTPPSSGVTSSESRPSEADVDKRVAREQSSNVHVPLLISAGLLDSRKVVNKLNYTQVVGEHRPVDKSSFAAGQVRQETAQKSIYSEISSHPSCNQTPSVHIPGVSSYEKRDPFEEIAATQTLETDVKSEPDSSVVAGYVGTSSSLVRAKPSPGTTKQTFKDEKQQRENTEGAANVDAPGASASSFGFENRDPFAELSPLSSDCDKKNTEECDHESRSSLANGMIESGLCDTVSSHVSPDVTSVKNEKISGLRKAQRKDLPASSSGYQAVKLDAYENPRYAVESPNSVVEVPNQGASVTLNEVSQGSEDPTTSRPLPNSGTTRRGSGPPDGPPEGGDRGLRKAGRKTSDIDSAYAKVTIINPGANVYQQVVSQESSAEGLLPGPAEAEEMSTGSDLGNDTASGADDKEETVVDPFNITAAEESIHSHESPWSYESSLGQTNGKRKSENFEQSMRSHLISYNQLSFSEHGSFLGGGAFGVVRRAKLTRMTKHKTRSSTDVAVKCLKEGASEIYKNSFKQEAVNLMKLNNTYIVRFLGISYDDEDKLLLITELVPQGSLHSYLKDKKNLRILGHEVLLKFAIQITTGMQYLESKKLVHRDLAARNILVASEGLVKISDFGLSRIYDDEYYRSHRENQRLPIRWMAPECLEQKKFTVYSDVWSLGVTLWEMFSYGKRPYDDLTIGSPSELIEYLKAGNQLQIPGNCPPDIFELVKECWNLVPSKRISFFLLKTFLEEILKDKYPKRPYFM